MNAETSGSRIETCKRQIRLQELYIRMVQEEERNWQLRIWINIKAEKMIIVDKEILWRKDNFNGQSYRISGKL